MKSGLNHMEDEKLEMYANRAHGNVWISKEEELVHPWDYDRPNKTEDPCTEGGCRNGWVVNVGHRGADLRIRRVIL